MVRSAVLASLLAICILGCTSPPAALGSASAPDDASPKGALDVATSTAPASVDPDGGRGSANDLEQIAQAPPGDQDASAVPGDAGPTEVTPPSGDMAAQETDGGPPRVVFDSTDDVADTLDDAPDPAVPDGGAADLPSGPGDSAPDAAVPDAAGDSTADIGPDAKEPGPAPGTMLAPCNTSAQCGGGLHCSELGVCDMLFTWCKLDKECGPGVCLYTLGGLDGTCVEYMSCLHSGCSSWDYTCPGQSPCGCFEFDCDIWEPPYPYSCGECVDGSGTRPAGMPCAYGGDCADGLVCRHVEPWSCEPPGGLGSECELASDCDGMSCAYGHCKVSLPDGSPCVATEECAPESVCGAGTSPQVCTPSTGALGEPCNDTSPVPDCNYPHVCTAGVCSPPVGKKCAGNSTCGKGSWCVSFSQNGVDPKGGVSDCWDLSSNNFVALCDGTTWSIYESCSTVWQPVLVGQCQPLPGTVAEGAACSIDWNCVQGLSCILGTCLPPLGPGSLCDTTPDCLSGLECDIAYSAGKSVVEGRCVVQLPPGEPCSADSQCADGSLCNNGTWPATCQPPLGEDLPCGKDEHCQSGLFCLQSYLYKPVRQCRAKATYGESCSSDGQCDEDLICDPLYHFCCGPI